MEPASEEIEREALPSVRTAPVETGSRYSAFSAHTFDYGVCPACGLGLVLDPRQDYESLYDGAYYAGRGADHSVDYFDEMEDPNTIRTLEWDGLAGLLACTILTDAVLDFGCGLGSLVRTLVTQGGKAGGLRRGWFRATLHA